MGAAVVWINGAFGAGKTTLAEALHVRLPQALPFDPEHVGFLLRRWTPAPPTGDFQDLALWRHLVVEFAVGMVGQYGRTLIVPMTLIDTGYREEIHGAITAAGVRLVHVFLDLDAEELRRRITVQVIDPDDAAADADARAFRLAHLDRGIAAAADLPESTLVLRSDRVSPEQLADAVLAHLGHPAQPHG